MANRLFDGHPAAQRGIGGNGCEGGGGRVRHRGCGSGRFSGRERDRGSHGWRCAGGQGERGRGGGCDSRPPRNCSPAHAVESRIIRTRRK
jgi:hypothetical protein